MYPKRNEKSSIKTIHRLFWASLNYIALVKVFYTMLQSVHFGTFILLINSSRAVYNKSGNKYH